MITLDEAYVTNAAPNAAAASNARTLVVGQRFTRLHVSEDETVLFGECEGSGHAPYVCSCDFKTPEQPVHRCNCPSRQFPCKHCLGLMYAWLRQPAAFTKAPIPSDLQAKREKASERSERKKPDPAKPKKVNKSALAKKLAVQLEGLDLLEKLTHELVRIGIGNMNPKIAREIEDKAKQLGDAYLPGAQIALRNYTQLFAGEDGGKRSAKKAAPAPDAVYSEAMDQLARLHALIRQGRNYLKRRSDDPDLKPETETAIAAWLGHAWQLAELKTAGLVKNDAELLQLAFNVHDDPARREEVETGVWFDLGDGGVRLTQNFRPYKAAKFIRSEDSFFDVAQVKELCIYPGEVNPRIRWTESTSRPATNGDFDRVRSLARPAIAAVVKEVKSVLRLPLAERRPIFAMRFRTIGRVGEVLAVEDSAGDRLVLTDSGAPGEPPTCHLFDFAPLKLLKDQVLVVRFRHDLDSRKLEVKPLAIVSEGGVFRLGY